LNKLMRLTAILASAVTAAALRASPAAALRASPASALRTPVGCAQRSRMLVASETLPAGWISGIDQSSGATYYFNEQTGVSQWELPQHGGDAQDLPSGWITAVDQSSGATYYINEQTGESQWEPPQGAQQGSTWHVRRSDGKRPWISHRYTSSPRFTGQYALRGGEETFLGRLDVDEKKPTRPWVSRQQCRLLVEPDGTAIVVSHGKPPTGWRAPGQPWQWLQQDEMKILTPGDEVSLDYHDPEGSVLACNVQ